MLYLSATTLIIALVIVVNQGGGQVIKVHQDWDQIAQESKPTRTAITLVDGPKYVTAKPDHPPPPVVHQPNKPDLSRPPSKPPIKPSQPIQSKQIKYVDKPPSRVYYSQQIHNAPRPFSKGKPTHIKQPNGSYSYPKVIPLQGHHRLQYYSHPGSIPPRQATLAYSASSGKPVYLSTTSPKFSLPVQTVNGIRSSEVRPPKLPHRTTKTTTTTTTTTTVRPLRNKRIWPKHILSKINGTVSHNDSIVHSNNTVTNDTTTANYTDQETSASQHQRRYVTIKRTSNSTASTSAPETTSRTYRRVTRIPKHKTATTSSSKNSTSQFKPNDWIPMIPSHYPNMRRHIIPKNRRSDTQFIGNSPVPAEDRRMLYLHSIGLVPLQRMPSASMGQKKMIFFRKRKRQLNPNVYSGYSRKPLSRPRRVIYGDLHPEGSHPKVVTKVKHHHHHHHHKYIRTVEKPVKVPFKVEVPKPYPVPVERRIPYPVEKIKVVEKKVPYPVQVEKKVPYPVQIKVPQPFPVKVVEKEYVPKPYPVVQQVPVYQQVEVKVPHAVPVTVEKRVPYPVHVKVPYPVDRPVAVPVPYEKKVHVPVPVRVLVPQPYPVETKVPYPVEVKVKEPVEVIKHVRVPVKVPVPHPVPFRVPQPVQVTVEKKVPYPVEVEKKVPVPFRIYVPQRVEVEKKVPVYVPKPYPVEKKVHVPVKVPVPVRVPVEVPVQVPIYVGHLSPAHSYSSVTGSPLEAVVGTGFTVSDSTVTHSPHHTVTVHGNGAFSGFSDRSDTTTPSPAS